MVQEIAGLHSGPSTDGPRLFAGAIELFAIEVKGPQLELKLRVFEGLLALLELELSKVESFAEMRLALLGRTGGSSRWSYGLLRDEIAGAAPRD